MSQATDNSTVEGPIATTANSRLYAFLLKLHPLQQGTLTPFSGELVHAAFLNWLWAAAPDVARSLPIAHTPVVI